MGCEQLGGTDWGYVDVNEVTATVRAAWDAGITVFDTADVYGLGDSERRLSAALDRERHEAVIVSKFGVRWQTGHPGRAPTYLDSSPRYIAAALENSLRRLRVDRVPVYLLHWWDKSTPLEDVLEELNQQRNAGKIGLFGVSNVSGADLAICVAAGASVVELPYSLVDDRFTLDIDRCTTSNASVLTYGGYAQGLLCGKYEADARFGRDDRRHRLPQFAASAWPANAAALSQLEIIATQRGVPMASVALRWVLRRTGITSVIVGLKTRAHLGDALTALTWDLSNAEEEALNSVARHARLAGPRDTDTVLDPP